ncbi:MULTISPECIES: hypothetical protein [Paenibacillus]|uniref:Transposase n=1 Tax=Paenibacillus amylolyticus TaxID=1451 RepID=A0ABD8AR63_PAEAM
MYLSAIKDLLNDEIVACEIGKRSDNELLLRTFIKAFAKQKRRNRTDRSREDQYTSHAYPGILPKVGVQINMSSRGNCYGNASMESFFLAS